MTSKDMENNNNSIQIANTNDVVRLGKVFFESGMFKDVQSMAQAIVKVQAGAELGISPFQAMSGVHIIQGKPCIGSGLMASKVDQHPAYDYEVLQQTDLICEIKFFKNGKEKGISKFTIEDAKRAGTQNIQKFPANMLFARAMSNGVKWYCPGVFAGPVYTPEEMGETKTEDIQHEVISIEKSRPVITLEAAITELNACTDRECSGKVYNKYPQFHSEAKFIDAVKEMAKKYPKPATTETT